MEVEVFPYLKSLFFNEFAFREMLANRRGRMFSAVRGLLGGLGAAIVGGYVDLQFLPPWLGSILIAGALALRSSASNGVK